MVYTLYEDQYCYYIWKPAGKHSSFGEEYSFLEELRDQKTDPRILRLMEEAGGQFGYREEYGLLNRLDTPTTGLLYFAKTPEVKERYKKLQYEGKVRKRYILEVWGDIQYWIKEYGREISLPIAHHKFLNDRMVVMASQEFVHKIKGTIHQVKTKIEAYEYSQLTKTSTLIVTIQKGIRHQIRSHFSAIGYPLVGDPLYGKKKDPYSGSLQLVSMGLQIEE